MNKRRQHRATSRRTFICVVFVQGQAADQWLQLIDEQGPFVCMTRLAKLADFGNETTTSALKAGDTIGNPDDLRSDTCRVMRSKYPPHYVLAWSFDGGHVGLYRPAR